MKIRILFIAFVLFFPTISYAQRFYVSTDFDVIFSAGMLERGGKDLKTPVRFAPYFNYGYHVNYDFTPHIGIISGLDLKNVGVIIKDTIKTKHRAYSIGGSLALKLGNMTDKLYFFAGGSYEYLFAYKEKLFVNNEKIKRTGFYSNDVNQFLPAVFAGVNLKGITFKVHYYLDDFFSKDYQFENTNGYKYPTFTSSRLLLFMVGVRRNIGEKKEGRVPIIPKNTTASLNY